MIGKRGDATAEKGVNWLYILIGLAVAIGIFILIMTGTWGNIVNYMRSTNVDSFTGSCNLKAAGWDYEYCCAVTLVRLGGSINKQMSCWSASQSKTLPNLNQPTFSCKVATECIDLLCPNNQPKEKCGKDESVNDNLKFYLPDGGLEYIPIEQGKHCCVSTTTSDAKTLNAALIAACKTNCDPKNKAKWCGDVIKAIKTDGTNVDVTCNSWSQGKLMVRDASNGISLGADLPAELKGLVPLCQAIDCLVA